MTDKRYSRQDGLAPHQTLADLTAVVVGAGAVGRNVAQQLALMGVGRIIVSDFDTVEPENLAPQGYRPDQLGRNKAEATAEDCLRLNPDVQVVAMPRRFAKSDSKTVGGAHLFSCVDTMDGRRLVYDAACKAGAAWFGDARAAGEVIRYISVPRPSANGPYGQTLFSQNEAFVGACSTKMVTYGALTAAALLVGRFAQFVRGDCPNFLDCMLDMRHTDLTVLMEVAVPATTQQDCVAQAESAVPTAAA